MTNHKNSFDYRPAPAAPFLAWAGLMAALATVVLLTTAGCNKEMGDGVKVATDSDHLDALYAAPIDWDFDNTEQEIYEQTGSLPQ